MSDPAAASDPARVLLDLYDRTLPDVFGYLSARCDSVTVAEDLTAETYLAAVAAARRSPTPQLTTAWLIGVARHKLVDHWRWRSREERRLQVAVYEPAYADDPWEAHLDAVLAMDVLRGLGAHHRAVLTLRYLDDLSVSDVADVLGRSLHATEALLVRARSAFRSAYKDEEGGDD